MELSSFKAVLLRKAQGNNSLQSFIKSIDDSRFADVVIEVLEKMPRATAGTGSKANGPITAFGANANLTDINMMRDALGHHLSHYKAALKAHHAAPEGSPEKAKMRQVADAHMDHLFPLMHLAARAAAHSRGSKNTFDLDYPNIPPWETNYTTLKRNTKGDGPLRDPKLLRVRTKNSGSIDKTAKDWHFLEMPPHPGHEESQTMARASGYPWEEIQLGKQSDVDAKKAFVHIQDIPASPNFTPHEFDNHPIRGVQDIRNEHLSEARLQQYAADLANWHGGEHQKNWIARMRALPPGEFMARGTNKAPHFYEGIPLQSHPDHVHEHMKNNPLPVKVEPKVATATAAAPTSAVAPTVRSSATQGPTSSPAVPVSAVNPSIRPVVQQPTQGASPAAAAPAQGSSQPTPQAVKPIVRAIGKTPAEQKRLDRKATRDALASYPEDLRNRLLKDIPSLQNIWLDKE